MAAKPDNTDNYVKHSSTKLSDVEAAWVSEWIKATGADKHEYVRMALLKFTGELQLEQNRRIRRMVWLGVASAPIRLALSYMALTYARAKNVVKKLRRN